MLPSLWFGFTMDQAVGAYVAWVWKKYHLVPYVGAWDLSFPGMYIVHRLALEIFGESILGFRLFDFLAQLSVLGMIFYLARELFSSSLAGFFSSIFYAVYYVSGGALETAEKDGYVLLLFLFCLVLIVGLNRQRIVLAVLSGLALGFAFLLKPFYGLSWLVLAIWFLAKEKAQPRSWLLAGVFGIFCLVPSLLVIAYYADKGALRELYFATLWYGFKVYGRTNPFAGSLLIQLLAGFYAILSRFQILFFLGILGIVFAGREQKSRSLFWIAIVFMLIGLFSFFVQGKYFYYHSIPFWGMMMLFAGGGLVKLAEYLQEQVKLILSKATLYLLVLVIIFLGGIHPQLYNFFIKASFRKLDVAYYLGNSYDARYYRAVKYLKRFIGRDDEIEFFGWHPIVPYLLKKKLPSRFCVIYHLFIGAGRYGLTGQQKKWIEEYTRDVIKSRPKFFLLAKQIPGWEVFALPSPYLSEILNKYFPKLKEFLLKNYRRVEEVEGIEVYVLKQDAEKIEQE